MAEQRPLRLLVVGVRWPAETFLVRLFKGLAKQGIEITLATHTAPASNWLRENDIAWLPLNDWNAARWRKLTWLLRYWLPARVKDLGGHRLAGPASQSSNRRQLIRFWYQYLPFLNWQGDVIYFPWNEAAIDFSALYRLQIPVVLSCRGSHVNVAPYDPARQHLTADLGTSFRAATAVHCVSQHILDQAQDWGLDPLKAKVITPAVPVETFAPLQTDQIAKATRSDDTLQLLSVGSLIWRKGYEYSLLAVRRILDQGLKVHYRIIGQGPEWQRVRYTVQDLNLADHVTLVGKVEPMGVKAELQRTDLFLLPSLSEGISNAVLEAMAAGVPVITSDGGGMTEAINHGVEGLVVPCRDVEAMAAALSELAGDPEKRRRMGEAARNRTLSHFALADQVDAFAELLKKAARSPHAKLPRDTSCAY